MTALSPRAPAPCLRAALLSLLVLTGLVGLVPLAAPVDAAADLDVETLLGEGLNAERDAAGLPGLQVDAQLSTIARDWSGAMAAAGVMSHNPLVAPQVEAPFEALAENVGWVRQPGASPDVLVDLLIDGWMASTIHRDAILGAFDRVGIGTVTAPDGTLWATTNFLRSPSSATATPVPPADPTPAEAPASGDPVGSTSAARSGDGSLPDRSASHVLLARSGVFADALGGSALAGPDAPLLFLPGDAGLTETVRAELDRVLGPGGTVYLLGGPAALSTAAETELIGAGYDVRRLAGPSRSATSAAVARAVETVRGPVTEILLAREDDWADAISGGAYAAATGAAVLVTPRDRLSPDAARFLGEHPTATVWALGGPAALADAVVAQAGAQRVSGPDRAATAVQISRLLWGRTQGADGQGFALVPGESTDGWMAALSALPWSVRTSSPQLLVGAAAPAAVTEYFAELGYGPGMPVALRVLAGVSSQVVDGLTSRYAADVD